MRDEFAECSFAVVNVELRAHRTSATYQCLSSSGPYPPLPSQIDSRVKATKRQISASLLRRCPLPSFPDLRNDLLRKRLQIPRIARGDDATVADDLLVLPLGAGIDHVVLDGMIGRHLALVDEAGLDQQQRRMADRGDPPAVVCAPSL